MDRPTGQDAHAIDGVPPTREEKSADGPARSDLVVLIPTGRTALSRFFLLSGLAKRMGPSLGP